MKQIVVLSGKGGTGKTVMTGALAALVDNKVMVDCDVDAADLHHIFNPFFTKKKYGTGLGMTQVKKIIDLHMGSIEISSNKGEGTQVIERRNVFGDKGLKWDK